SVISTLSAGCSDLPNLHLMLRYDASAAHKQAFALIRRNRYLSSRCHFWTDTEQLAEHYRKLGAPEIGILPIPHYVCENPNEQKRKQGPLVLAYLGGARGDKGFDQLPELVGALADKYLKLGRVRFLVQSSYSLSLEEPKMAKARRKLANFPRN